MSNALITILTIGMLFLVLFAGSDAVDELDGE